MSDERKQILTMLAEGTITAEEAGRLLDRIEGNRAARNTGKRSKGDGSSAGRAPKDLRVWVQSSDGDHVSIRVPLRLIRTGVKLTNLLPSETNARLAERGLDLNELGSLEGEELVQALRELKVDVNSPGGDTVRVFCE